MISQSYSSYAFVQLISSNGSPLIDSVCFLIVELTRTPGNERYNVVPWYTTNDMVHLQQPVQKLKDISTIHTLVSTNINRRSNFFYHTIWKTQCYALWGCDLLYHYTWVILLIICTNILIYGFVTIRKPFCCCFTSSHRLMPWLRIPVNKLWDALLSHNHNKVDWQTRYYVKIFVKI